MHSEIGFQE